MTWIAIIYQYDSNENEGSIFPVKFFETEELAREYIEKIIEETNDELTEKLNIENENDEDYSDYIESRYTYSSKVIEIPK